MKYLCSEYIQVCLGSPNVYVQPQILMRCKLKMFPTHNSQGIVCYSNIQIENVTVISNMYFKKITLELLHDLLCVLYLS